VGPAIEVSARGKRTVTELLAGLSG
jgi:hypothetical protein